MSGGISRDDGVNQAPNDKFNFETPPALPPVPEKENSAHKEIPREQQEILNKLLLSYCETGNDQGIMSALKLGADPNATIKGSERWPEREGMSALQLACWAGPDCIDGVKALIDAGAEVNYRDPKGSNAILLAAQGSAKYDHYNKDAEPLIDALIKAGAGPDDGFSNGKTPLFICVNEYDGVISLSAVKAFLKHGANPNAVVEYDTYSSDLLTHSTWTAQQSDQNAIKAVKALVEAGANVNPRKTTVDHLTSTPLGAAADGSLELVRFLLEKQADPHIVDAKGNTLIGSARSKLDDYISKGYDINNQQGIVSALEGAW